MKNTKTMYNQTPKFTHKEEIIPLMQLLSKKDNLKEQSSGGQMLQYLKILAIVVTVYPEHLSALIRYGVNITNTPAGELIDYNYTLEITPLIQLLCKLDDLAEESNGGQMAELVKETAIELNVNPNYISILIRYGIQLRNDGIKVEDAKKQAIVFDEMNVEMAKDQPEYGTLPALVDDESVIFGFEFNQVARDKFMKDGQMWIYLKTFGKPMQPIYVTPFKEELIKG